MEEIQKYLREMIDENAVLDNWNPKEKLSLYLAGSFQFYLAEILNTQFLLIKPYENKTVQNLKKQMDIIGEKTSMQVAVILEKTTNYRIKKMIQERIAFVSTERQLYIPFLALHIQKQKKQQKFIYLKNLLRQRS